MNITDVNKKVEKLFDQIFSVRPLGACRLIREFAHNLAAEALEEAARIAEAPISNGHSVETRAKGHHANLIARNIRAVKDSIIPKEKRTRRLN
jgi:dihydroxyacetone kinase DhaKLM complex PTS-EIIA-like component DhaM